MTPLSRLKKEVELYLQWANHPLPEAVELMALLEEMASNAKTQPNIAYPVLVPLSSRQKQLAYDYFDSEKTRITRPL